MKDIGSLLKNIQQSKSEIQTIVDTVYSVTGINIQEKDILFSTVRGITKIKLQISGAKKTLLTIKKGVLQEKLKELHIILL